MHGSSKSNDVRLLSLESTRPWYHSSSFAGYLNNFILKKKIKALEETPQVNGVGFHLNTAPFCPVPSGQGGVPAICSPDYERTQLVSHSSHLVS